MGDIGIKRKGPVCAPLIFLFESFCSNITAQLKETRFGNKFYPNTTDICSKKWFIIITCARHFFRPLWTNNLPETTIGTSIWGMRSSRLGGEWPEYAASWTMKDVVVEPLAKDDCSFTFCLLYSELVMDRRSKSWTLSHVFLVNQPTVIYWQRRLLYFEKIAL